MLKQPINILALATAFFVISAVFSGCSSLPSQQAVNSEVEKLNINRQLIKQREQQLRFIKRWRLQARFSLVTDSEAWSGKIGWQQHSENEYQVQFSLPSGQGAMQLTGDKGIAELRLANGNTFQATDADTLLRQQTDWDLPISSLWYWIRGLPDATMSQKFELDAQGLLVRLEQDAYQVDYQSYHQLDKHRLPRKIIIENGDLKLKLIVMGWVIE